MTNDDKNFTAAIACFALAAALLIWWAWSSVSDRIHECRDLGGVPVRGLDDAVECVYVIHRP